MALAQERSVRVAVDLVALSVQAVAERDELQVVLVRLLRPPFAGMWGLPGGLVGERERVEETAERELWEKTGIRDVYLEQLRTFSDPDRDPNGRCVSVAHLALVPRASVSLQSTAKYGGIAWFPLREVPKLAYDHREILDYAVARLRGKLAYTNIAYGLLPEEFSLGELQQLYETICGRPLDPRNFRRRIAEIGLVVETGRKRAGSGQKGRPAQLYRFTSRTPQTVQVLGSGENPG